MTISGLLDTGAGSAGLGTVTVVVVVVAAAIVQDWLLCCCSQLVSFLVILLALAVGVIYGVEISIYQLTSF